MKDAIKHLQSLSSPLEPDATLRKKITEHVVHYAEDFLKALAVSPAYNPHTQHTHQIYEAPFQESPKDISDLLNLLNKHVITPGLNPASGKHLGFIPGGGLYATALADYLSDVTNRASSFFNTMPGTIRIENKIIQWLCTLVGYPATAHGNLTSGGSIATLIALVTARDAHSIQTDRIPKTVIYLTNQTHLCIEKALRICGLGQIIKRTISVDSDFRMQPDALQHAIIADKKAGFMPWLIAATAGTTNTGSIDPLETISDIAKQHQLWFHVDAAYGGFFMLTKKGKALLKGIEQSDSVVLDPHKGLFLPYGTGAVLVKNRQQLLQSHAYQADYLHDTLESEEISPSEVSPELTRPFRGLRIWLPLQLAGLSAFRAALEEKLLLATYFYETLQTFPHIEIACPPPLSIVVFRVIPKTGDANDFNKRLVEKIQQDGRVFLTSTILNGNVFIRFACLSFRTHLEDVETTLTVLREKIGDL